MKQTIRSLFIAMFVDFFVSTTKITGGIISGSSALIADGFYTFSNFITDILAVIGTKLSKKRPNKTHPFGFGKVEYLANIFIGILIFVIGIFIFFISFMPSKKADYPWIYVALLCCLTSKYLLSKHLLKTGKEEKNQLLVSTSHIARMDASSTSIILGIMLFSQAFHHHIIFHYIDMIVSIIISFEIIHVSYHMMKDNMLAVIGETEQNSELLSHIEATIEKIPNVDVTEIHLIKYGNYYKASLKIKLQPSMTLRQLINLEKKINRAIKREKFGIKYTTIELDTDN